MILYLEYCGGYQKLQTVLIVFSIWSSAQPPPPLQPKNFTQNFLKSFGFLRAPLSNVYLTGCNIFLYITRGIRRVDLETNILLVPIRTAVVSNITECISSFFHLPSRLSMTPVKYPPSLEILQSCWELSIVSFFWSFQPVNSISPDPALSNIF